MFNLESEVLCLDFRPDGKQLCITALSGQLYFYDPITGFVFIFKFIK